MENIKLENQTTIVQHDLAELHRESNAWVSEIELWEKEIAFFEKLLKNHSETKPARDLNAIRRFLELCEHYDQDLLEKFKSDTRDHEKELAVFVAKGSEFDATPYLQKHGRLASHIGSFRAEFSLFKKQFFEFMERLITS